jgi:hypothetical protein
MDDEAEMRTELDDWRQAAKTEASLRREFLERAERAEAENERLRAALRCEAESGTCVMVHDPERSPCTPENCSTIAKLMDK